MLTRAATASACVKTFRQDKESALSSEGPEQPSRLRSAAGCSDPAPGRPAGRSAGRGARGPGLRQDPPDTARAAEPCARGAGVSPERHRVSARAGQRSEQARDARGAAAANPTPARCVTETQPHRPASTPAAWVRTGGTHRYPGAQQRARPSPVGAPDRLSAAGSGRVGAAPGRLRLLPLPLPLPPAAA